MTELDLQKFINKNNLECSWSCRSDEEPRLILWIDQHTDLKEFTQLIGYDYTATDVIKVSLLPCGDIAVDLIDICIKWDINPLNITKHDFDFEMHGELAKSWE